MVGILPQELREASMRRKDWMLVPKFGWPSAWTGEVWIELTSSPLPIDVDKDVVGLRATPRALWIWAILKRILALRALCSIYTSRELFKFEVC